MVFLAFDVFFMMFCIGMACIFFFALFCCIPLAAIAYAMKIREGASEDDIRLLPRYRFCDASLVRKVDDDKKQALEAAVELGSSSSISDLALHPEDSVSISGLSFSVFLNLVLDLSDCSYHFIITLVLSWTSFCHSLIFIAFLFLFFFFTSIYAGAFFEHPACAL